MRGQQGPQREKRPAIRAKKREAACQPFPFLPVLGVAIDSKPSKNTTLVQNQTSTE
jgi:hypothetical protein